MWCKQCHNQLAPRFLLFRVFSYLRCTSPVLSSFWSALESPSVVTDSRSPLNIRIFQWQRSSEWALPWQDLNTEGTGWLKNFCSWKGEVGFCSKDRLSKGSRFRRVVTPVLLFFLMAEVAKTVKCGRHSWSTTVFWTGGAKPSAGY